MRAQRTKLSRHNNVSDTMDYILKRLPARFLDVLNRQCGGARTLGPLEPLSIALGEAGFFDLSQSGERPERWREPFRFDTIALRPSVAGVSLLSMGCSGSQASLGPLLAAPLSGTTVGRERLYLQGSQGHH